MRGGRYVRLRVGEHEVAVAAEAVLEAVHVAKSVRPLPRRGGVLVGACDSRCGVVPLLDLARWLDLGPAETPGQQALVLRSGDRAVAVRVSAMHGVAEAASVARLHHDEDPAELFQSTVRWVDAGSAALLEVQRLMALTRVWCEDAGLLWSGTDAAGHARAALPRQTHGLLGAGGSRWAIPSQHLVEVIPALPLEFALPPGSHARGICAWRGRKLAVLDLATLRNGPGRVTQGTLLAVVLSGDLGAAFPIDTVQQIAQLDIPPEPVLFQSLLAPDGAEVLRVDVAQLLGQLPEAEISRGDPAGRPGARAAATSSTRAADAASYLLFEADTTYAAPVSGLVQVMPLDAAAAARLQRGEDTTVPFRGQLVPLLELPSYGGRSPAGRPRVALVVAMPDGCLAAVAVQRVTGWAYGETVHPGAMRAAAFGELQTITITQGAQRTTHMVVELSQVAYMFA
ncbi:chemotaxis protein CheW [Azohydromonas aeria]|uniref:chemotaxis protein CheW n=1 Tax=Azohydromonas aeria TaxID=2590212 RepID=UPI0012F9DE5A|nr:chemotaxis protein CheW [Azohydromonas aeria]